ncbi:hypothetical protein Plim_0998 [Planctopirus limnophila DSM 3776]|uniref:Tetratricopeptide repeat protein n=1 Tax=Planctopirus limnophila (strain ATCC 43296 / DSM 3776 / IFAM 1008 / Mu 290) TaxID=521674 RepID=D5ST73_PLAL2|nr:hypothetical protein [Planctopirus limnophila]ADG66841.1 hypothetical protein Plim_0998 [Planctopirus limnophila DSM 3776]
MTLTQRGMARCYAGLIFAILPGLGSVAQAEIPSLIQRQPASIQQAWIEVEKVVNENEKLPQPLPEPYLARGDLWSRVGSHEDALSDYLKATELFFQGSPTPSERARYLSQLQRALDAVVQQPKPRYPNEAASEYSQGLLASRSGEHTMAESHFAEACRLMPEVPLYRVYRALALRELGRNEEAHRQVAAALSLIRESPLGASAEMQLLHRGLEHIQGPSRLWLSRELELISKSPATKPGAAH